MGCRVGNAVWFWHGFFKCFFGSCIKWCGGEAGDEAILPLDIFYKRTESYIDDAIARATAAAKAADSGSRGNGGFVQNINIESPEPLSPYEVARQTRNQTRNLVLQLQRG